MSFAEKVIDRCREFEQSDFLELAMLAIDQAMVRPDTFARVREILEDATGQEVRP